MPRADGPRDRRRRRSRSRRASRHAAGAQSSASRPPRDPPQDAGSAWLDPVWDQCLRELLVDLPLPVAQALVGLGPQSCEDVRCIWSSSEALMEELADVMHADLNTRTNEQIARLWSFARREGLRQRDETVRTVVVARQSSYLPRRARGSERPPEPADPPRQVRLVRDVGGPRLNQPVVALAGQSAHVREDHQKQVKLDSLFQLVVTHVVDLASLGTSQEDLQCPAGKSAPFYFDQLLPALAALLRGAPSGCQATNSSSAGKLLQVGVSGRPDSCIFHACVHEVLCLDLWGRI